MTWIFWGHLIFPQLKVYKCSEILLTYLFKNIKINKYNKLGFGAIGKP